ncbi:MAG TPA: aldo/keto reductase [Gemmatimonadaceae bacterium]|nr:aldo/keto reductase [Gemmatimonadaceae bacterium]
MNRRTAIKTGVGAGASLLMLDSRLSFAQSRGAMIRKKIPSSGEEIPVIGLGSSQTFNLAPRDAEYTTAQQVIKTFHELGGKVIDTSPTYQRSEIFIGETVKQFELQSSLFLATKLNVQSGGRDAATQQMEGSSRTLGKRTIDLMQVWNLGDSIRSLTDQFLNEHIEAAAAWKAAGRARYIGITTSRDPQYGDFEAAMRKHKLDFVQLDYSIDDRIPEQRLLPLARERGMAVIVNRPFSAGGIFRRVAGKPVPSFAAEFDCTSWAQFLLKFVVSHPAVTCTIPATGDVGHLRDNMGACFGRLPDEAMRRRMVQAFEAV